jgi:addiction module HigA family antidote
MNKLALDLRVPVTRLAEIIHECRGITPDTALRLARYFNTSARFWRNLQGAYDLGLAEAELADRSSAKCGPRFTPIDCLSEAEKVFRNFLTIKQGCD